MPLLANSVLLAGWTYFLLALAVSLVAERLGPRPAQTSGLLLDLVGVGGTAGLYVGMLVGPGGGLVAPGPGFHPALAVAGSVLAVGGWALFGWARLTLGRWWSADVQIKEAQPLRTDGPYAYVRHPIYSGLIATGVGSLLLTDQPAWLPALGAIVAYTLFKAWLEEAALAATFGPAWTAYCRRVPPFLPRLRRVNGEQ